MSPSPRIFSGLVNPYAFPGPWYVHFPDPVVHYLQSYYLVIIMPSASSLNVAVLSLCVAGALSVCTNTRPTTAATGVGLSFYANSGGGSAGDTCPSACDSTTLQVILPPFLLMNDLWGPKQPHPPPPEGGGGGA